VAPAASASSPSWGERFKSLFRRRPRPWLSDSSVPYPAGMPFLYDPSQYSFVPHVEANWRTIRAELLAALNIADSGLEPYKDIAKTDKKAAWRTAGLMYWTMKSKENIARFPKTWEIFKDIPNLTSCSIHLLEPHSTIKPHIGDTDAMLRCHMGLVVPAPLPRCGFRVGNEMTSWEEGKVFIFNDAREHTAWNNTDQNRYVISFDVILPQYAGIRHWIAAQVLGKIYVEVMYQHKAWLRPYAKVKWINTLLHKVSKLIWYGKVRLRARLP
jgi:aspartyl/asparaginyl beta-hydroxylase (cupin superfamily)